MKEDNLKEDFMFDFDWQKIEYLANYHDITINRYKDAWGSWRVGLDWDIKTGRHEYVCEDKNLSTALNMAVNYVKQING